MELIIIGVYDDATHARNAKNDLLVSGFSPRHVQLNPEEEPTASRAPAAAEEYGGVGNFFRSLFNLDTNKNTYSNLYAEAVKRGSHVLTVDDIHDDSERLRAEEIMQRYGPVDIEERSGEWVREGWRGHDPASQGGKTVRTFQRGK